MIILRVTLPQVFWVAVVDTVVAIDWPLAPSLSGIANRTSNFFIELRESRLTRMPVPDLEVVLAHSFYALLSEVSGVLPLQQI